MNRECWHFLGLRYHPFDKRICVAHLFVVFFVVFGLFTMTIDVHLLMIMSFFLFIRLQTKSALRYFSMQLPFNAMRSLNRIALEILKFIYEHLWSIVLKWSAMWKKIKNLLKGILSTSCVIFSYPNYCRFLYWPS
jgi:hypothetical protein